MLLLTVFLLVRREREQEKEGIEENQNDAREKGCKKRMTIILLNAYKQRPCAHTYIDALGRRRGRERQRDRNSGFNFFLCIDAKQVIRREDRFSPRTNL